MTEYELFRLKTIGWIGGGAIEASALIYYLMATDVSQNSGAIAIIATGGVVWTSAFLLAAYNTQKKAEKMLQSSTLLKKILYSIIALNLPRVSTYSATKPTTIKPSD